MLNLKFLKNYVFLVVALLFSLSGFAKEPGSLELIRVSDLPVDAQKTLVLIKQGGPFAYAKDGVVFGNYEKQLPKKQRGYYHEYTVKTPGARNRGARRIIAGGEPVSSGEYYYTDNHYATFRRIKE